MASLYTMNAEFLSLVQMYQDGEIDEQTFSDSLESIECDFEDKADNIAYLITETEGRIAVRDKEIERLDRANTVDENLIKKLNSMLFAAMELRNKPKFKTAMHSFSIAGNGGLKPLVYAGGNAPKGESIPEAFRREKKEYSVDTEKVREILDKGLELDWVHYGERGRSLRIK